MISSELTHLDWEDSLHYWEDSLHFQAGLHYHLHSAALAERLDLAVDQSDSGTPWVQLIVIVLSWKYIIMNPRHPD